MTAPDPYAVLDRLVDRAARGVLGPAEGPALRIAVQALRDELVQARRTNAGQDRRNRELANKLATADGAVSRARELAADMRTWCSPHNIAQHYADQLDNALNGPHADR